MWKQRTAWALWLLGAAALWLFENGAATLTLLLASVVLPLLSIWAARRASRALALSLAAPERIAKGSAANVAVAIRARGALYRVAGRVSCENRLTGERVETEFACAPRSSGERALALAADAACCGTLRLRAEAWTEDMFGLWRSRGPARGEVFVTVEPELFLPRVTLAESTTVISDGERYSQTRAGSDPSETFAIRAYRPGDPIRQIHWKLSEKTNETMLRELGLPVVNRTLLVFRNLRAEDERTAPRDADAAAEVFLSVSRALAGEGCAHTAAFAESGAFALTEVQNEADFAAMRERFLTLAWETDDGALARLLAETPYAHVAVVGTAMPPDAERFCRGNRVTLLSIAPPQGAAGVFSVPFTAEGRREELKNIEL